MAEQKHAQASEKRAFGYNLPSAHTNASPTRRLIQHETSKASYTTRVLIGPVSSSVLSLRCSILHEEPGAEPASGWLKMQLYCHHQCSVSLPPVIVFQSCPLTRTQSRIPPTSTQMHALRPHMVQMNTLPTQRADMDTSPTQVPCTLHQSS